MKQIHTNPGKNIGIMAVLFLPAPKTMLAWVSMESQLEVIVQIPLEHSQAWSTNCLSRKPVPVSYHPQSNNSSLISSLKLPWYNFMPFPNVLSQDSRETRPALLSFGQRIAKHTGKRPVMTRDG